MKNNKPLLLSLILSFFLVVYVANSFGQDSIPSFSRTFGPYGLADDQCLTYFVQGDEVTENDCNGTGTPQALRKADEGASKICIGPPRTDFSNCFTFASAGELVANVNPTIYIFGIPIWVP